MTDKEKTTYYCTSNHCTIYHVPMGKYNRIAYKPRVETTSDGKGNCSKCGHQIVAIFAGHIRRKRS